MGEMSDWITDHFVYGPVFYDGYEQEDECMTQFSGKIFSLRKNKKGFSIKEGDTQHWFQCNNWEITDEYKGAEVSFTYSQNGQWKNVNQGDIQITKAAEPYTGGGGGNYRKGSGKKGGFDQEGQRRGNALHAASRIVSALVVAGKVDTAKDAAEKAVQTANYLLKHFDPNGSPQEQAAAKAAAAAEAKRKAEEAAAAAAAAQQSTNDNDEYDAGIPF